ncbi:unnamed protein product [Aureobasidium mustum]|uniref:Transcription factor domain-containing protein n=1 Tax=Aureobasidium mustum TaxID=2773714 RepID=A0A9N8KDC5_9PEZI|nr:unnamed protein product [Aureobasidium mustum]
MCAVGLIGLIGPVGPVGPVTPTIPVTAPFQSLQLLALYRNYLKPDDFSALVNPSPWNTNPITPPASGISQQIQVPVTQISEIRSEPFRVESVLFDCLPGNSASNSEWPEAVQIFQLWQTYIDNVNPMVNLLHVQTMQRMVLQAASCRPETLSKQSRALLSSIFLTAIESLNDEEEKNLQGMTIFAAEMHRRLWWQIYLLNRHYVNLCEEIDSSDPAHNLIFDTKRPLNFNDADLHPEMTTIPPEREGVTEMLFCSIRYEIGSFVRNLGLHSDSQSKIQAIQELEARLEERYARHCDGSIPLQRVSRCLVKTTGYRLALRHCHLNNDSSDKDVSTSDRQQAFDIALLLLQTQHSSCASQMLDRYRWHTKLFYCFEALFPVLHSLAFQELDKSIADEAWQQVSLAYHYNPELLGWDHQSFYSNYCHSLNNLALRAWNRRASTADCVPEFVQQIQIQQSRSTGQNIAGSLSTSPQQHTQPTQNRNEALPSSHDTTLENPEIDAQSWEYWLNIFDNEELLGI